MCCGGLISGKNLVGQSSRVRLDYRCVPSTYGSEPRSLKLRLELKPAMLDRGAEMETEGGGVSRTERLTD